MKVLGVNGSPRRGGNTSVLIDRVLAKLGESGIETEVYELGGKEIHGCRACYACFKSKDKRCAMDDDVANEVIAKMAEADGIILASPTYFSDLTPELKALIDRAGFVGMANGAMFRRKVGAAVVAVRRAGSIHVFDSINHFFLISQMIVPGSRYWNVGIGREKGEVAGDEEGMKIMDVLGENMAWLLERVAG
jgi:multimeric flavodoxin WrbA